MRGRQSVRKEISNKVKKVLAHQSSRPAVGGDISLVHFVNREIVCRGSGLAAGNKEGQTHAEDEGAQGKENSPFSLAPPWFRPLEIMDTAAIGAHHGTWVSLVHSESLSIIRPAPFTPCWCGTAGPRAPVQGPREVVVHPFLHQPNGRYIWRKITSITTPAISHNVLIHQLGGFQ